MVAVERQRGRSGRTAAKAVKFRVVVGWSETAEYVLDAPSAAAARTRVLQEGTYRDEFVKGHVRGSFFVDAITELKDE